jgi:hypothetical protein
MSGVLFRKLARSAGRSSVMRTIGLVLKAGVTTAATLIATGPAIAQSVNIDFGNTATAPSAAYGAAGVAGVWNSLSPLPQVTLFPLVGLDGAPIAAQLRNIGGTSIINVNDPATSGDDQALIDDMLISLNNPTDACIFFIGLRNGAYEVTTYAITPGTPGLLSRVTVDFADQGATMVGGAWAGVHAPGLSYARHTVQVTNGRIGGHSGLPSGFIQSGINGMQLRLVAPSCPGDIDNDGQVGLGDISVIINNWGVTTPPGTRGDEDQTGAVGLSDVSVVISGWGLCA